MSFANLHLHTYLSDGSISPNDLVKQVYQFKGLDFFALTDHDSLSGIEPVFRFQNRVKSQNKILLKRFVPGVEISTKDEESDQIIHILGFFPRINEENYNDKLPAIEDTLGDFCRKRSSIRGIKDMDSRIEKAHSLNLDGLGDRFGSAKEVIGILREKAESENRQKFKESEKENDLIQHPIPVTYQIIVDYWEELMPHSSKEKITQYILRQGRQNREELTKIYMDDGLPEKEAADLSLKQQGILSIFNGIVIKDIGIMEGLDLLKQAGAVTILAHPAVDHGRIGYHDFDNAILYPLIKNGLDGIEVYYPYDLSYREEALNHYLEIATKKGLLVSGGTDYHGDGRAGLDDVKLGKDEALRIINRQK